VLKTKQLNGDLIAKTIQNIAEQLTLLSATKKDKKKYFIGYSLLLVLH